jgi:hypothetical protein
MSDLDHPVRDELRALADDAPRGADLWDKIRTRIRVRQRRRLAIAIVGLATLATFISLAVAVWPSTDGGRRSVAVSPTSRVPHLGSLTPSEVTFQVFSKPPSRVPAALLSLVRVVPGGFDSKLGVRLISFTPTRGVYLFRSNSGAYCLADVPSFGISCTTAAGLADKGISFEGSPTPDRKSIDGVGMAPDFVTRIRVNTVNIPIHDNVFRITVRSGDTVVITTKAGDLTMPIEIPTRQP